jgi:dihydrodipicolinate synthase/N-acetylneuraminate lyase
VELVFVQALKAGNLDLALQIVNELEAPFFRAAVPQGWHVALKEALHELGLMSPEERLPMARVEPGGREGIRRVTKDILHNAGEMLSR